MNVFFAGLGAETTVRGLARGARQMALAGLAAMGDAAWIEVAGMHIILASERNQCFHPTAFTALGLDPGSLRAVVVKSSYHYRAGFGPIAADMITADAPGPVRVDFAAIPYRRFTVPYWPKVESP